MYPSSQLAEMHSEAMKIGTYDLETGNEAKEKLAKSPNEANEMMEEERKICPCCGFRRQTDTIKICTPMDQIKNIGTSTQLYFATFKSLSLLLAVMFLVYSIYAIISSAVAAKDNTTIEDYIRISLAAKQLEETDTNKTLYYVQCWLGLLTMLLWIAVMVGIKYF